VIQNAVVISVVLMIVLSLFRINVVVALTLSAVTAGVVGGLPIDQTISVFNNGLGGGASIAMSYAMLGAFAAALSRSGLTDVISRTIIKRIGVGTDKPVSKRVRYTLLIVILLMAVSSQNILPIHIAFIPILIPPLLHVMSKLKLDRRLVATIITFGLITTYMVLPIGFGAIFLKDILLANLTANGLDATFEQIPRAMLIPGLGMLVGLLIAIFFTYRKPREYDETVILKAEPEMDSVNWKHVGIAILAVVAALVTQLTTNSMTFGALVGFAIFNVTGVLRKEGSHSVFIKGMKMMANIGFIMIAAAGFSAVIKETGAVTELVDSVTLVIGDRQALAALLMLIVGLLVTMGIGSSFSTIPIIATIYVPLAMQLGFSVPATIALVGTAAALGDAGSPASDSTLGPTAGLNADGQHDHIWDSVVPTFLHFNIPLIIFGWIAAMVL
jgi:predicted histidine transporter YuiF (NhaC family)